MGALIKTAAEISSIHRQPVHTVPHGSARRCEHSDLAHWGLIDTPVGSPDDLARFGLTTDHVDHELGDWNVRG